MHNITDIPKGFLIFPKGHIEEEQVQILAGIAQEPLRCKRHSIETHNYHMRRYHCCLYCMMGSEPVPKAMLDETPNEIHVRVEIDG